LFAVSAGMAVYWDMWFLLFGLESSVLMVGTTACAVQCFWHSHKWSGISMCVLIASIYCQERKW